MDFDRTVREINRIFDYYNSKLYAGMLEKPVILVQSNSKHKYALGWCTASKVWTNKEKTEGYYEITLSAEYLHREATEIVGTILHEMVHLYISNDLYILLQRYALENKIFFVALLFDISVRQVQQHLKVACNYLGLKDISTHSFRKLFATELFYANGCNVELIRQILNHSSVAITQRYLGLKEKEIETALESYSMLPAY